MRWVYRVIRFGDTSGVSTRRTSSILLYSIPISPRTPLLLRCRYSPCSRVDVDIHSRKLDIANERLPQFDYAPTSFPLVPVPSMRQPLQAQLARSWHGSGSSTPTSPNDDDVDSGEGGFSDGGMGGVGRPPGAWPQPLGMEALIRRTLEEDEGDGGVVERLAERIASGRKPTGRPRPLKRHETT